MVNAYCFLFFQIGSALLDGKKNGEDNHTDEEELDEAFVSAEFGAVNSEDEKTAVSIAMEQLLADMDHRSESPSDADENNKESTDEGDDDVFREYRKHLSSRDSLASQSDNEQSNSGKLRSSSSKSSSSSGFKGKKLSSDLDNLSRSSKSAEDLESTEKSVLRSVKQMSDHSNSTSGSGETTLQVLRSVSEINEPEGQEENHCIQYLDDKFVTKRSRGSGRGKKSGSMDSYNSSRHESSGSLSEEFDNNKKFLEENNESEDERPDSDLLRDYQTTLSQVLSEDEELPTIDEDLDQTLNAEEIEATSPRSEYLSPRSDMGDVSDFVSPRSERSDSVYETPETSLTEQSVPNVQTIAENVAETVQSETVTTKRKSSVPSSLSAKQTKSESSKTFLGFDIKKKKTGSIKSPKVIKSDVVNTPMMPVKSGTIIRPHSNRSREGSVESNPLEKDAWGDSSSCGSLNSVKDATQKTWRPLPPVPIESAESPKQSKTVAKTGTGRKLPDPNQVQTKSPVVFQSNFMKKAFSSNTDSGESSNKSLSPIDFQKPVITTQPRPLPPKPDQVKVGESSIPKNQKDLNTSGLNSSGKTKISVDYSKLAFDKDSGSETDKKKKIPVAMALKKSLKPSLSNNSTTSAENQSDNNDIPFADDSEDEVVEEKFFTPATSIKPKRPAVRRDAVGVEARKRILPTPPKAQPAVLSADKIRDIRKAEIEKARQEARERARLKSDEELGLRKTPYSKYKRTVSTESSQSNYASTSDKVSDSEDVSSPVDNVTVTFTPDIPKVSNGTPKLIKGKKKKKSKSRDGSTSSMENGESDLKKDKKKKSLLAAIFTGVKTPQKDLKDRDRSSSNDTLDDKSTKKKGKTPKTEKKKDKKKRKTISVDDTLLTDNMKDLKIGAVFIDKPGRRSGLKSKIGPPKASGRKTRLTFTSNQFRNNTNA